MTQICLFILFSMYFLSFRSAVFLPAPFSICMRRTVNSVLGLIFLLSSSLMSCVSLTFTLMAPKSALLDPNLSSHENTFFDVSPDVHVQTANVSFITLCLSMTFSFSMLLPNFSPYLTPGLIQYFLFFLPAHHHQLIINCTINVTWFFHLENSLSSNM